MPPPRHILLDTGVLGLITHPSQHSEPRDGKEWLLALATQDNFYIPEICDYELRRELLRMNYADSVARLNGFKSALGYVPITTAAMLKAAELWAHARRSGIPTADAKAIDADMILAAQAMGVSALVGSSVVVATTNVRHLSHFVDARHWREIA